MIVRDDERRRIEPQRLLDHLARIHRSTVDSAPEHLAVFDQPMLRIQKQHCKDFMLEARQFGDQVFLDQCWRCKSSTALHFLVNGLTGCIKNLVY